LEVLRPARRVEKYADIGVKGIKYFETQRNGDDLMLMVQTVAETDSRFTGYERVLEYEKMTCEQFHQGELCIKMASISDDGHRTD